MENRTMVEIKNLKKTFPGWDHPVLNGVDITVKKGDVVVILGPSGSGKTTLLRCINFLGKADEGQMTIGDMSIDFKTAKKKDIAAIRAKSGFVFQNYCLFNNKTALENVMLGLTVSRKVPKAEAERIAKEMLEKVGLGDRFDYYPSQLSGGQQQRVGIARAIALNPDVVLFDEPTSALDPISTSKIEELAMELKKRYTIVIVTHNMQQALRISDRTAFFLLGELIEYDDTEKMFSTPSQKKTEDYITGRFG
mgnify:CR=1 FL=1